MSEENTNVETQDEGQQEEKEQINMDDIKKLIQSETDKVRTEYSKKLKSLEKEKEDLLKEKMSEDEKKAFEFEQLQKELSDKEKAIQERELNLKTIELLKESELPLEFRSFVVGIDEDTTIKNVEAFKAQWQQSIKEEVDKRFKASGREVERSEEKPGEVTKEQFNKMGYKERVKLATDNPELYKKLKG